VGADGEACPKSAQSPGNLCIGCGGGLRCQGVGADGEACPKSAQSPGNLVVLRPFLTSLGVRLAAYAAQA